MSKNIKMVKIVNKRREDDGVVYYINYNNKSVTAKRHYSNTNYNFKNDFREYCAKHLYQGKYYNRTFDALFDINEDDMLNDDIVMSATVYCFDGDTFDETTGMDLAFLKLKRSEHNYRMTYLHQAEKDFYNHLKMLKQFENHMKYRLEKTTNRTAETCKKSKAWR